MCTSVAAWAVVDPTPTSAAADASTVAVSRVVLDSMSWFSFDRPPTARDRVGVWSTRVRTRRPSRHRAATSDVRRPTLGEWWIRAATLLLGHHGGEVAEPVQPADGAGHLRVALRALAVGPGAGASRPGIPATLTSRRDDRDRHGLLAGHRRPRGPGGRPRPADRPRSRRRPRRPRPRDVGRPARGPAALGLAADRPAGARPEPHRRLPAGGPRRAGGGVRRMDRAAEAPGRRPVDPRRQHLAPARRAGGVRPRRDA